tara:strand:+ start:40 stop:249 length:210 start_codon:yes stop_codon:yes gene_type:complete
VISKKDYDMIANVFNKRLTASEGNLNAYTQGRKDGIATVAMDLAYVLQAVSPRFNMEKWITATTKRDTN